MSDLDTRVLAVVKRLCDTNRPAVLDTLAEMIPDANRDDINESVERLKRLGRLDAVDVVYGVPTQ